jgi:hypothetical protein
VSTGEPDPRKAAGGTSCGLFSSAKKRRAGEGEYPGPFYEFTAAYFWRNCLSDIPSTFGSLYVALQDVYAVLAYYLATRTRSRST